MVRTEAASARMKASSAREQVASQAEEVQQWRLELGQVIRERDQPRSHAAEAVSWAEVPGGQLAEAMERPTEVSARVGALAETRGCEGPSVVLASSFEVEILPLASTSRAGADLAKGGDGAEGGDEAEGAAPPPGDA